MGIFPSKIVPFAAETLPSSGTVIDGVVKFVELRGSRKIAFVSTDRNFTFTIQLSGEESVRAGDRMRYFFGEEAIQVFDRQSQRNVIYLG